MLASYTFNTAYHPQQETDTYHPGVRLLEGGKFSPGEYAPVIIREEGAPRLKFFQWSWGSSDKRSYNLSHCIPSSHVFDHVDYYRSIRQQRCLIPADGYYVRLTNGQCYKVAMDNHETFCFAGIHRSWQRDDGTLQHSFALLSTQANPTLSQFSLLMPLILRKKDERMWLHPHSQLKHISKLLYEPVFHPLTVYRVKELLDTTLKTLPKQLAA